MDNKNRCQKEQTLRSNKIANGENLLRNMYKSLMYSEKEGTIKQEIYNIFKDEMDIIDIINSENQWVI